MDCVWHFQPDKQRMAKLYSDVFGWLFVPDGMPYTFAITEVERASMAIGG